jgi:hypothetical protein
VKTCKDYGYLGLECCRGCHYEHTAEDLGRPLIAVMVDGELAHICCELAGFFYPDNSWKDRDQAGQWSQNHEI